MKIILPIITLLLLQLVSNKHGSHSSSGGSQSTTSPLNVSQNPRMNYDYTIRNKKYTCRLISDQYHYIMEHYAKIQDEKFNYLEKEDEKIKNFVLRRMTRHILSQDVFADENLRKDLYNVKEYWNVQNNKKKFLPDFSLFNQEYYQAKLNKRYELSQRITDSIENINVNKK